MLQKPCRLQTDGRTDGQTDRRTDKVNPVYPPPTSLGGGITSSMAAELKGIETALEHSLTSPIAREKINIFTDSLSATGT